MTSGCDSIAVLEAAYAWREDESCWLGAVVDALAPFGFGAGTLSYLLEFDPKLQLRCAAAKGAPLDATVFRDTFGRLPDEFNLAAHAPSNKFVSVQEAGTRTAALLGASPAALTSALGYVVPPSWGLRPGDAGRFCWATIFFCAPDARPSRATIAQLGHLAPHLASAARLRFAMTDAPHADDEATEAVLEAGGAIVDARGAARSPRAREHLAALARTIDRARTRRGRAAAADALTSWTALIDGRWSIVESFEADGRRYLLARRNAPDLPEPLALSASERAVTALAVQGQPHKLVAYALGMSRDTVHRRLQSAMRKLRVSSRAELIRVYAPLFAGLGSPG